MMKVISNPVPEKITLKNYISGAYSSLSKSSSAEIWHP